MSLPNVYDGIFEYAKEYIEANSIYGVKVLRDIPQQSIFPIVIIKQYTESLEEENLDKTDQRFNLYYEVEIYAIDKLNALKQEITKELIKLTNDVLDNHYGFRRTSNQNVPNADLNVYRQHITYQGLLDEKNKIYRR